jgi:hypothetical protein
MIVTCPRCANNASITASTPVLVTCPRAGCASQFVAMPAGSGAIVEAELREIAFRCARTARRFFVVFGRLSKSELFSIRKIHDQEGWLKRALTERRQRTSDALDQQLSTTLEPPPSLLSLLGQVLIGDRVQAGQRRTGTALVAVGDDVAREQQLPRAGWQRLSAEEIIARTTPAVRDDAPFNTAEFDFDGFSCFHCASQSEGLFVLCNRCRELVCYGRGDHAGHFHRCTVACGASGRTEQRHFGMKGDRHSLPVSQGQRDALGHERTPLLGGPNRRIGRE